MRQPHRSEATVVVARTNRERSGDDHKASKPAHANAAEAGGTHECAKAKGKSAPRSIQRRAARTTMMLAKRRWPIM